MRAAPEPDGTDPRIIGIDDWCKRKGQTYGTIVVDLEQHRVVDVLEERSAETVAEWFQQHPGIEVISRDRGNEYIQGATEGAPEAIQVADRWHLLKNLREALERLLEQMPEALKAAASKPESIEPVEEVDVEEADVSATPSSATPSEERVSAESASAKSATPDSPTGDAPTGDASTKEEPSTKRTQEQRRRQARHARRQARYERVKQLAAESLSQREIGRRTSLNRRTVAKYIRYSCQGATPSQGHRALVFSSGCLALDQAQGEIDSEGETGSGADAAIG